MEAWAERGMAFAERREVPAKVASLDKERKWRRTL